MNAERRASVSQTFEPPAQPQRRPRRDWASMVDANGSTDHHFCGGIDVLLHLANANGFDHCHQVSRGQAFDQSPRIPASVRKPRKKRLRRLVRWHGVGLFKEYLADALVVHGVSGWGCRRLDQRAGLRAIGAVPTPASAGVGRHAGSVGLARYGSQNARGRPAARVASISRSPTPLPDWQAKRAPGTRAKASAMDAEGARRHQRLDAQHDSATWQCRGTHKYGCSSDSVSLPRSASNRWKHPASSSARAEAGCPDSAGPGSA
ncbi:hypothetical protein M2282_005165 [Variovorax boronicumulans]|nr:hypothetical protein [Variovorax boronicumulans]